MKMQSVILLTRMYAGDFAKTTYSDYQLIGAVNFVLWLLAQSSAKNNNIFLRKTSPVIAVTDGEFDLPADFFSLVKGYGEDGNELLITSEKIPALTGEILIQGRGGFSGEDEVTLVYNAFLPKVLEADDELDVPDAWEVPVARAAGFYVTGSIAEAKAVLDLFLGEGGI